MTPKWQKLASLAQEICTLWFQFFCAVFASKGYPFKKHTIILSFGRNSNPKTQTSTLIPGTDYVRGVLYSTLFRFIGIQ